jgi:hypothetical protein
MADDRLIADTLDAVIVGLADSLTEAQEQLSTAAPLDTFGRPNPQYRIPYLDFEIGFRLDTQTSPEGRRMLLFVKPTASAAASTVTSKISGRFVAVPPGEGMPLPVLSISATGEGATRRLAIRAGNTSGEALAGASIQLNVDLIASQALSTAAGVAEPRISDNVQFTTAVLTTDQNGLASTDVTFGPGLRVNAVVLITAELGTTIARTTIGKAM